MLQLIGVLGTCTIMMLYTQSGCCTCLCYMLGCLAAGVLGADGVDAMGTLTMMMLGCLAAGQRTLRSQLNSRTLGWQHL
jgi:hypothetical protein